MLDVVLIVLFLAVWAGAMIKAYWKNGGMEDFKKNFRKVLDTIKKMW
jgi:hypothetical protein